MKKKLLVPAGLVVALAFGVAGFFGYNVTRANTDYDAIQAAVSAQKFADDLHDSEQSTFDCDAQGDSSCQAMRYYVTADKCESVVQGIVSAQDAKAAECQDTRSSLSHDGQNFGAMLAKLDVGYQLTVWSMD